jgi:hypothetical protein
MNPYRDTPISTLIDSISSDLSRLRCVPDERRLFEQQRQNQIRIYGNMRNARLDARQRAQQWARETFPPSISAEDNESSNSEGSSAPNGESTPPRLTLEQILCSRIGVQVIELLRRFVPPGSMDHAQSMNLIELIDIARCLDPTFIPNITIRPTQVNDNEEYDYPSFPGSDDTPTPFASEEEEDMENENNNSYRIVQ